MEEAGKERISHIGNLSEVDGEEVDDGLSNVDSIMIDGNVINMETDLSRENIFDSEFTSLSPERYNIFSVVYEWTF